MPVKNGKITPISKREQDVRAHLNLPRYEFAAKSDHQPFPVDFYTYKAAEFWIWLQDEIVRGREERLGRVNP